MPTTTEMLILNLLMQRLDGCYGSELIHLSQGKLKRGSIYSLLSRAEKNGYVKTVEEAATAEYALPRTRYRITANGRAAMVAFAEWTGLAEPHFLGEMA